MTLTVADALVGLGLTFNVYGKTDVGGGFNARFGPAPSADGFHGGKSASNLPILTRAADVARPTKPDPLAMTDDADDRVHPEDWATVDACVDFLRAQGGDRGWVRVALRSRSSYPAPLGRG